MFSAASARINALGAYPESSFSLPLLHLTFQEDSGAQPYVLWALFRNARPSMDIS